MDIFEHNIFIINNICDRVWRDQARLEAG
jgi:hypothetical protein